jgi:drug/metabolite transporter superfamily protein YnfA
MTLLAWIIFLCSAILEVGGDALIRKGLRTQGTLLIILGFLALGCYGLVVNLVRWDFSKLLGVYVAVFAIVSVLAGRYVFHEAIPNHTWVGVGIMVCGGLVIQFGAHLF